ncbi:MAG: hypothetical protein PHS07_03950 [Patescibacteria group bacterium]|nr:hypothetical protein [Patescibacteria group bacterium]
MSKIFKIIIIIVLILTLIVVGYYFLFLKDKSEIQDENGNQISDQQPYLPSDQNNNGQNNQLNLTPQSQPKVVSEETKIKNFSRSFSERFGTYSNQGDYGNLEDLMPLMSDQMQTWAENYIIQQRAKNLDTSVYSGITTKALTAQILSQSEISAQVKVSTQRIEKNITDEQKIYYQDLILDLVKLNNTWLVDSAEWQAVE